MSDDNYTVPMTDARGRNVMAPGESEPRIGSVVLSDGLTGTAWQRHSDGMWHCTVHTYRPRSWHRMMKCRNLVLVYDAPERVLATSTVPVYTWAADGTGRGN